jgi:hypothetical protein
MPKIQCASYAYVSIGNTKNGTFFYKLTVAGLFSKAMHFRDCKLNLAVNSNVVDYSTHRI